MSFIAALLFPYIYIPYVLWKHGVDIIWVIDTSGSMSAYDEELLAGIEAMLLALPESGWRLAMMSNDPGEASIESQFPLVPGDDIVDAEDRMGTLKKTWYKQKRREDQRQ